MKGVEVRMVSMEAKIYFELPEPATRKIIVEMTRDTLKASSGADIMDIKEVVFRVTGLEGKENITHAEAWKKLQTYIPKASFKLPVVGML